MYDFTYTQARQRAADAIKALAGADPEAKAARRRADLHSGAQAAAGNKPTTIIDLNKDLGLAGHQRGRRTRSRSGR